MRRTKKADKTKLEVGKRYKLTISTGQANATDIVDEARLIALSDKLALFDNGRYKYSQMVNDFCIDWHAKEIRR